MKKLFTLLVATTLTGSAFAQSWLQINVGFMFPSENFNLQEGNTRYNIHVDPRPGPNFTVGYQYDWPHVSLYGSAGIMNYRSYTETGPWASRDGAGLRLPVY